MNLLSKRLTEEEILKCIDNISDFDLNIAEGGYVSNDRSAILIQYRQPYVGQLLQFSGDVKKEILDSWVAKICKILKIKGYNSEG